MYKLRSLLSVVATLFVSFALCSQTQAAPRTFVSGLGKDANPCTREAPCRTFQVAHDAVDDKGEVLALDSAGYGVLTITKNVTISGEGVEATANATTPIDGITIATAGLKVVLRSITVEGFGAGTTGINVSAAVNLTIQHCVIHGFTNAGLNFTINSGTGKLSLSDSKVLGCLDGVYLFGSSPGMMKAEIANTRSENNGGSGLFTFGAEPIRNSVTSGNGVGILVSSGGEVNVESCESSNNGGSGIATANGSSIVRVSRSVVTGNGTFGFNNTAGGTFETYSFETTTNTNLVNGNNGGGAQTTGTITPVAY